MYYSSGNYDAFARPRKPHGVDDKKAYLVGAGLASMAAAGFLVRDGQMRPENITIFEASGVDGGALDGAGNAETGWKIRGGREMENHFECLWDLYRSVPSLEVDGSVLDEFYWLNKDEVDSTGQRNSVSSLSAGVSKFSVFLGREFNRAATLLRSSWVRSFILTPLGKY